MRMLHMWHIYVSRIYVHRIFSIYAQFDLHICFSTCFAITCEAEGAVDYSLVYIYAKMLGLYAHLAYWPCELLFQMW